MAMQVPTLEQLFKAAQHPEMWFDSATRLQDAAEAVFRDQLPFEQPYFAAVEEATFKANLLALEAEDGIGSADIIPQPPNYLPGQLLYGFAMENVLKGLIIGQDPTLIGSDRLDKTIMTHDLMELAVKADFVLALQEPPILEALTSIAIWAGRYPTALRLTDYSALRDPLYDCQQLLDFGSQHPSMRLCFQRMLTELGTFIHYQPMSHPRVYVFKDGYDGKTRDQA